MTRELEKLSVLIMDHPGELTLQHKYDLLLHVAQQTRATLDLDTILNVLLDEVKLLVDYDAGGIFIRSEELASARRPPERQVITGIARRGFDPGPVERDSMLMKGEGVIGHVIRSGEAMVLDEVHQDPHYVEGRATSQSEIALPIFLADRVIGALNLESDRKAAFNEKHLEVLRFFADAAAISIEKAMLHLDLLEKEHLADQLRTARMVQSRLLPERAPLLPGYELSSYSQPAYEIGGDYYDYIPLEGDRLGLVMADVVGDGIPAALVMSAFRALLRTYARREVNPAYAIAMINRLLPEFSGRGDFVTCFYACLEPGSGQLSFVNGGHNPPIYVRSACEALRLTPHGPALGILAGAIYQTDVIHLAPGEQIILYTDGVVEQHDKLGDAYGLERLEAVLCQLAGHSAGEIIQGVIQAVQQFSGRQIFEDDFTLMVVRRIQ